MMQSAICHYSYHRVWERDRWNPARLAQEARRAGAAGFDVHVRLLGDIAAARGSVRKALVDSGLALSAVAFSNDFSLGEATALQQQLHNVEEWLLFAADMGASTARIFGGFLRDTDSPQCREAISRRIVDYLGRAARQAEKAGIVLALENHGRLPCSAEEQVGMIEAVSSPWLRATLDLGNYPQAGQDCTVATAVAAKYAAYVHVKDYRRQPDSGTPWGWSPKSCVVGTGEADIAACLDVLRDAGYEGFVALEHEMPDGDEIEDVARSMECLNRLLGRHR